MPCYCWPFWKKPKLQEKNTPVQQPDQLTKIPGAISTQALTPQALIPQFSVHPAPANNEVLFKQSLGLGQLFAGNSPTVDIVAVHGLDGHREESWTAENQALWLKDYLPEVVPNARIFSYGYDGRTYGSTPLSCQTLYDHAVSLLADLSLLRRKTKTPERPIIFIAHSIGGIILKSALIHANLTGEGDLEYYKAIKISTYGILFFGTPHQGAENFKWEEVFLNIASQSKHASGIVLKNLGSGSEWLQQQLGQYARISSHFDTKFFYETYTTEHHKLGTSIVVPKGSAVVPGATDAEVFAIHNDHTGLVKYISAEDNGFQRVSSCISLMAEQAPQKIQENWQQWRRIKAITRSGVHVTFEISFELDYHRNPNFTGRAALLNSLDAMIKSGESKVIILYGTGGMGKTQIALEYAHSHATEYTAVFWVNVASKETATTSFITIAHRLISQHAINAMNTTGKPNYFQVAQLLGMSGLVDQDGQLSIKKEDSPRIIKGVKRWFSQQGNEDWLLIFDNVDDLDSFDIVSFIPSPSHGTVIMTSRRRDCVRLGDGVPVEVMSEQEAVHLLFKIAQLNEVPESPEGKSNLKHKVMAAKLTKRLGYLPLSIDQAGAYIATRLITLEKYLNIFEENFSKFSDERPPDSVWSYGDRTAFTTWEISFEAIKSENENAAELLLLCSFFSNEDIWEDMLRRGKKLGDKDLTLGNSLRLLFSYSLAQRMRRQKEGEESFYVHPMVHEWARERLSQQECLSRVKGAVALLGQAVKNSGHRPKNLYLFEQRITSHIEMILRNTQKYLKTEINHSNKTTWSETEAMWMGGILRIVRAYRAQGRLDEAEELEVQVVEALKRILPEEHPDTLTAIANLAETYRNQGRPDEAEKLELHVMETRKRVLGKNDPITLSTMNNLALTYINQGRWEEAEVLNLQVLEARKALLREDDVDTLVAMSNLASLYLEQGEWKKAEELGLSVVPRMERVLGEDHPHTLLAAGNLAMSYLNQGRFKEAENLQLQAYERAQISPGKEHPNTLVAMGNLATIYTEQSRFDESEKLGLKVIEMREKGMGKEHPETLMSMYNLGAVYSKQGKWREAEGLQIQVLDGRKRVLGEDHPDTLKAMNSLVEIYLGQGLRQKAVDTGLLALESLKRVFGMEHPDTLRCMGNLAGIYSQQGYVLQAEELGKQVVEARRKKLGKDHPDTLTAIGHLATTLSRQGKFAEAEELNTHVMEATKRVFGIDHPNTWKAMSNLAFSYASRGRWEDAGGLHLQVAKASIRVLGKENPRTLEAQSNLVKAYWDLGRRKEAEELSLQVVEVMAGVLGETHTSRLRAMANLALIYIEQKRWEAAEAVQLQVVEGWNSIPGGNHDSWSAMADLVVIYANQRRNDSAKEMLQKLVEAMEKEFEKGHPNILATAANLTNVIERAIAE